MAGEFRHGSVGTDLTQAEWESITGHAFDAQAKGDILAAISATQLSRLAVGTNDQVLTADSAQASGVKWAAAGGGTDISCRVTHSAAQSLSDGAQVRLLFDTERYDTDTMHYTSAADLTGTVAKTNGSATLTGTTTAFDTELAVGQVISVPGVATEKRVVTAIASATSLTVNSNFANTASGQTAARLNTAIVARTAGLYVVSGNVNYASNSVGVRWCLLRINDATVIGIQQASASGITYVNCTVTHNFAQWDFVELEAYQTSGGALNLEKNNNYSPELMMAKILG